MYWTRTDDDGNGDAATIAIDAIVVIDDFDGGFDPIDLKAFQKPLLKIHSNDSVETRSKSRASSSSHFDWGFVSYCRCQNGMLFHCFNEWNECRQ